MGLSTDHRLSYDPLLLWSLPIVQRLHSTLPQLHPLEPLTLGIFCFRSAQCGNPTYWSSVGLFILCYFLVLTFTIVHKVVLSNISSRRCLWTWPLTVVIELFVICSYRFQVRLLHSLMSATSLLSQFVQSMQSFMLVKWL